MTTPNPMDTLPAYLQEAVDLGNREGWNLFLADGIEWQLQYDQDGGTERSLSGDHEAWERVFLRAACQSAGNPYRAVLQFLRDHSPAEYKRIVDLMLLGIRPVY